MAGRCLLVPIGQTKVLHRWPNWARCCWRGTILQRRLRLGTRRKCCRNWRSGGWWAPNHLLIREGRPIYVRLRGTTDRHVLELVGQTLRSAIDWRWRHLTYSRWWHLAHSRLWPTLRRLAVWRHLWVHYQQLLRLLLQQSISLNPLSGSSTFYSIIPRQLP